jgi:hypothetical protein
MFTVADRVQETTNSPGTGTATLLGAVSGYQSFSTGIGANNTTFYVIADQLGTNWEVGLGALNSTGTVLTRTTVYSSSNGGSTVNFATGTQYVWCDFPSSKSVIQGAAVNFSSIGAITAGTGAFTALSASSTVSGAGFSNYFAAPPTIGNTTPNAGTFTALVATSITDSGLTAGRVNYNGVGGLLTDSANMTFDGSTLTTLNSAYTGTLTGGTGIVNLGSGQFYKDASGNVGIGTSSPVGRLQLTGTTSVSPVLTLNSVSGTSDTKAGTISFLRNTTQTAYIINDAFDASLGIASTDPTYGTIKFLTAGSERMRIDSSGNLLVGNTVASNVGTTGGLVVVPNSGATYNLIGHTSGTASGSSYCYFFYNGNSIGSITQNGTTAVLYNTTSDYRLKTDVTPIQNALATVEALNPVSFTWTDGRKDDGFLAHEIQAVIPNCVTGEKDAVNEDGTPKYQQMDNSGVIPFLVKAIQEQQALITDLQTRLTKAGL